MVIVYDWVCEAFWRDKFQDPGILIRSYLGDLTWPTCWVCWKTLKPASIVSLEQGRAWNCSQLVGWSANMVETIRNLRVVDNRGNLRRPNRFNFIILCVIYVFSPGGRHSECLWYPVMRVSTVCSLVSLDGTSDDHDPTQRELRRLDPSTGTMPVKIWN